MSNHRPHDDPGPSIALITISAALTLTIAAIADWILLGNNTIDDRHISGFVLGNTLAVVVLAQTVTWASERAHAQAQIRQYKDLQDRQEQARRTHHHVQPWTEPVKSFERPPAAFTKPRRTHSGGKTLTTYRAVQEDTTRLELVRPPTWATAETQIRVDATGEAGTETVVLQPADQAAETQAVPATDESAETQVLHTTTTGDTSDETIVLITGDDTTETVILHTEETPASR